MKREQTILVVDDLEDNRLVVKSTLKREKYNFLEAKNGKEAIDLALNEKPDLIILDIDMPEVDGFKVIETLKEFEDVSLIPIIIITGFDIKEFKFKAIESGAIDFITKPFDRYELSIRVKSLLNIYSQLLKKKLELEELNRNLELKVKEKSEKLKAQLFTDSLTTLPNRFALIDRLNLNKKKRSSLILVDINSFKAINNFYGFDIGDSLLREFAKVLREFIAGSKFECFKIHADEFALFIEDELSYSEIMEFITSLKNSISQRQFLDDTYHISLDVSVGVAIDGKNLYSKADMAIKGAKSSDKGYFIYSEEHNLYKKYEDNIKWTKRLKKAIKESRVICVYQPIINNRSEKIEKYETLVRLVDEDGKLVSPFFFLEIAKQVKLYPEITKRVISQSLEKFKELKSFNLSINLSFLDIVNPEITEFIFSKLDEFKECKRVTFEILESEGIDNFDSVIAFIEKAKSKGCKISIDDFGSGYSNFSHLMKLKVDYIKIDGSMIKNLPSDENSQIIVATIVNFANQLGVKTVAEFVHSDEVYKKVKELGVDYSQGFYLGEPNSEI